jgi:sarcosine oxidase subunit beta
MKQIRDALIIGSGIIGSATALALTRLGNLRVTLLEKGPLVSGMTRRCAGLAHPFQTHPLLCEFANASHEWYSRWAMELGAKSPFVETGAAVVTMHDAENAFALWQANVKNASGIAPNALRAVFPNISEEFRAAMFTPHAGYADAVMTAQGLVNAAKERGLEVQTGTQVKNILVQQRRVQGVKTTTGEIEAPLVIVAAGGWSERLLGPLGIGLRLQFRHGIVAFYELPHALGDDLPLMLNADDNSFFRPHPYHMGAAGIVATEPRAQTVEQLDELISLLETSLVNDFVSRCLPAFQNPSPKRAHTILYDTLNDGLPALGRASTVDGLYIAAGFGTSAFAVAPAVGETLAQWVIDGDAARDLAAFDPLRHL